MFDLTRWCRTTLLALLSVVVVAGLPAAPASAASAFSLSPAPTIEGTPRVGSVLTAAAGTWKPSPLRKSYQWFLNSHAVSGATGRTWTVPPAAKGKWVTVKVTATRTGYLRTTRTSARKLVRAGLLSAGAPSISGVPQVHQPLTAQPGTWPIGTTLTYLWSRNGAAIAGATGPTYTPGFADEDQALSVRVTGSKPGYATTSASSTPVTVRAPYQLLPGENLLPGQYLSSQNGQYKLVMQTDGNLVEYGPSGAVWASGTSGAGNFAAMQTDGNLVVYTPTRSPRWESGSWGYGSGVSLSVQDDANLVLYRAGSPIWTRAVVTWITVGPTATAGSSAGTQSMSGPTLQSTLYRVYPRGTRLPVVCGTTSGQGVTGAYSSALDHTWHRLLGGDWVPDADFLTGTNGLVRGEADCTPAGGGVGASKIDAYVVAHPAGSQVGDGQCVALVKDYLRSVWGESPGALGNAVDYRAGGSGGNFLAANGWTWSTDQNFGQGDVLVWSQTVLGGGVINYYGHVALWYNGRRYDQNGAGGALRIGFGSFFNGGGNVYVGHWHHG